MQPVTFTENRDYEGDRDEEKDWVKNIANTIIASIYINYYGLNS